MGTLIGTRIADAATGETVVPLIITRRSAELPPQTRRYGVGYAAVAIALALALGGAVALQKFPDAAGTVTQSARAWLDRMVPRDNSIQSAAATDTARDEPVAPEPATAQVDAAGCCSATEAPLKNRRLADTAPGPVASAQPTAPGEGEADPAASRNAESADSSANQPSLDAESGVPAANFKGESESSAAIE